MFYFITDEKILVNFVGLKWLIFDNNGYILQSFDASNKIHDIEVSDSSSSESVD